MLQYNVQRFFVATLFLLLCQFASICEVQAFAASEPPPQFTNMPGLNRLEENLSQWNIYHDQGYTEGRLQVVNQHNDKVLNAMLMHGSQNYADIHVYRNLPSATAAMMFRMDVSFLYQDEKPIQALEFTMNKWTNNVRWEWALQWQIVPDGTSLAATPHTWRVWTGSTWQSLRVQQRLPANSWHTLHLYGNIVGKQVHYVGFRCDTLYTDMSQLTFSPVASSGDKLAVAVQLDGNYQEAPYSVSYNNINLHYR